MKVRPKNTGDNDNLPLVFVGDSSLLQLGSWSDDAVASWGNVYIDGSTNMTVQGDPPASSTRHLSNLALGSVLPGYKDPAMGYQTLNTNGCSYTGTTAISTCDNIIVNGLSMSGMTTPGIPRDFQVINAVSYGTVEFVLNTDGLGGFVAYQGPTRVDCAACDAVRLHGYSAYNTAVEIKADAFLISGLVDKIEADAIAIATGPTYRNFTTMLLDGVVSRGPTPYSLTPVHSGFAGPGLIDVIGSPDYLWTVDGQGAVSSNQCAKRGDGFAALQACSTYSSVHEDISDRSLIGGVRLRLLENVPSSITECDITVEVAGGCTACDTSPSIGEPAGGRVLKYGGTDFWGRPLRNAGDWTVWALNDWATPGQDVTVEFRDTTGGTACTAGSGCDCDGVNAVEISVDKLPALYDVP